MGDGRIFPPMIWSMPASFLIGCKIEWQEVELAMYVIPLFPGSDCKYLWYECRKRHPQGLWHLDEQILEDQ